MGKIYTRHVVEAIVNNDIELAKKLFDEIKLLDKKYRITTLLINKDNYKYLEIAINHGLADKPSTFHLDIAAGYKLDVLKTCMMLSPDKKLSSDSAKNAAKYSQIEVLEFLLKNNVSFNWGPSMVALENDDLKIFKWLENNVPDKVYHNYYHRRKQKTFDCPKYLYSLGYMPEYNNYKQAINNKDTEYAEWLISIKCPGTYKIYEIPEDYNDKFRHNLDPGDIPWILKLVKEKRFPSIEETYWTPPILRIIEDIILYLEKNQNKEKEKNEEKENDEKEEEKNEEKENDEKKKDEIINYIIYYISHEEYTLKYLNTNILIENIFSHFNIQRIIELIELMELNDYFIARLYRDYENQYDYDYENDCKIYDKNKLEIKSYLLEKIKWGYVFLVDLNNWINYEGSYHPSEFISKINELWKEHEKKIPQLQDQKNKDKWKDMISQEDFPWKDEMHEFLYELKMWD